MSVTRGDWAFEAARQLSQHSGFTAHPEYGDYHGAGYGVSPYPARSEQLPAVSSLEELSAFIRGFFERNRDVLRKPGHYVGGWRSHFEPSPIVLDVAVVTPSKDEALELQERFQQRAIYKFGDQS